MLSNSSSEETSLLGYGPQLPKRTKILMGKAFVAGLGVMAIVSILVVAIAMPGTPVTPGIATAPYAPLVDMPFGDKVVPTRASAVPIDVPIGVPINVPIGVPINKPIGSPIVGNDDTRNTPDTGGLPVPLLSSPDHPTIDEQHTEQPISQQQEQEQQPVEDSEADKAASTPVDSAAPIPHAGDAPIEQLQPPADAQAAQPAQTPQAPQQLYTIEDVMEAAVPEPPEIEQKLKTSKPAAAAPTQNLYQNAYAAAAAGGPPQPHHPRPTRVHMPNQPQIIIRRDTKGRRVSEGTAAPPYVMPMPTLTTPDVPITPARVTEMHHNPRMNPKTGLMPPGTKSGSPIVIIHKQTPPA